MPSPSFLPPSKKSPFFQDILICSVSPTVQGVFAILKEVKKFVAQDPCLDGPSFLLGMEELLMNVVSYGCPEAPLSLKVTLSLKKQKEQIVCEIIDTGKAFNPLTFPEPDLTSSLESRKAGGLGIYLAKQHFSDFSYRREENKNYLSFKKTRKDPSLH